MKNKILGNSINFRSTFIANVVLIVQMLGLIYFSIVFSYLAILLLGLILGISWRVFLNPSPVVFVIMIVVSVICLIIFVFFFFFWPGKKKYVLSKQGNLISVTIPNQTMEFELNQIERIESLSNFYFNKFKKKVPIGVYNNVIFLWKSSDFLYFASPDPDPSCLYAITLDESWKPNKETKGSKKMDDEINQFIIDIPDIDEFLDRTDLGLSQ